MPYQTGTSTGPADLLAKLVTFATANGWAAGSPSSGAVLSKNGIVCGLNATATDIQLRGALGAGPGAWSAQVNSVGTTATCNMNAGPFPAYHFYSVAESGRELLAAVVEISAGVYRHFILTQLIKLGTWTGGTYIAATNFDLSTFQYPSLDTGNHCYIADANNNSAHAHVHCDADGRVNSWSLQRTASDTGTLAQCTGSLRSGGILWPQFRAGYSRSSLRTLLIPMWIYQNRSADLRSKLGQIPGMRHINIGRYAVGQQDNFGGDNYQVWPANARGPTHTDSANGSGVANSGWYGYAYLRT